MTRRNSYSPLCCLCSLLTKSRIVVWDALLVLPFVKGEYKELRLNPSRGVTKVYMQDLSGDIRPTLPITVQKV